MLRINLAPAATPAASATGTSSPAGASGTGLYVDIPLSLRWERRRTPEGRPYFVDNTLTQQRGLTYDAPLPSLVSKPWPHLQDGRSVLHPSAVCTSLATTLEQLPGTTHGCLQTSTITRCSTRATLQAKACLFSESAEDAGKCNIEIRRTRVLGDSYGAVVGRIGRI